MNNDQTTFTAEEAVTVQRELRRAMGLEAERFPLPAFVGMISDEIEQLRAGGRTDIEIAQIVKASIGRDLDPETIARFYAPPEARRREDGHG